MTRKAIDLEVFKKLSLKEQLDALHSEGVHVGKQMLNGNNVILYQLNNFYVEVHYKEYRKNVTRIVVSKDVGILQPYLSQVVVRDLDKNQE